MQFKGVIHSKAPHEGRSAEPAYMRFEPDEGFCFQVFTTGARRVANLAPLRGDTALVPINGEDVQPLFEAKQTKNDEELLRVIRKYIQTRGLGLGTRSDSLSGTTHTLPEGSVMLNGRVRHALRNELDEVPVPRSKSSQIEVS